jgi:nucleotide-binding universal stress UspA family protein
MSAARNKPFTENAAPSPGAIVIHAPCAPIDIHQAEDEEGPPYNGTIRIPRSFIMFKNILVPTDGSELSDSTVARAIVFAKEANARVTFFYSQPDFPMPIYGEGALIDPTTPEQFSRAAAAEAESILSRAKTEADIAGIESNSDTVTSEVPYEAIIEAAERNKCDLIFMASHGRRGLSGLLLGSETQKVLTHSKIPVLVYR